MLRALAVGVSLALFVAGCGQPSPTSFARYELDGGRYLIEIDNTGSGSTLNFHSRGEGTTVTDEKYDLTWDNSRRLQIVNGALTIDGIERGTLQHGDRIHINSSGEVLVNGTTR